MLKKIYGNKRKKHWKPFPYSHIGKINIVLVHIYPKQSMDSIKFSLKHCWLKFVYKHKSL